MRSIESALRRSVSGIAALGVLLFAAAPVRAQTSPGSVVGTYTATGSESGRSFSGTFSFREEGDHFALSSKLAVGKRAFAGSSSKAAPLTFTLVDPANPTSTPATGLATRVTDVGSATATTATPAAAAVTTLELKASGATGFTGVFKCGTKVTGKVSLTRRKAVLLIHAGAWDSSHENAFGGYAAEAASLYRARGYSKLESIRGAGWEPVIAALGSATKAGYPYDRVIFVGHGGWDGPILSQGASEDSLQVSASTNPERFARLVSALSAGTTPEARIAVSACHAGGSDRFEKKESYSSTYVWVDDVAAKTGRTVVGPAGKTSTEYTARLVLAMEGEGVTAQETRWARGSQAKSFMPGTRIVPVATGATPRATVANTPLGTENVADPRNTEN